MFTIKEKIKTWQAKSLQLKSFKYRCQLKNLKEAYLEKFCIRIYIFEDYFLNVTSLLDKFLSKRTYIIALVLLSF